MAEYIEREAVLEAVKHAWAEGLEPSQYIEIIPAADVAPVVHGRWKNYVCTSGISIDGSVYDSDEGDNPEEYKVKLIEARNRRAKY